MANAAAWVALATGVATGVAGAWGGHSFKGIGVPDEMECDELEQLRPATERGERDRAGLEGKLFFVHNH